jgi:hypothetical protein
MSRLVYLSGAALLLVMSLAANVATPATPSSNPANGPTPLFTRLWWACQASDYLAFVGDDDWLPNKATREKLVVLTWRDGIQTRTLLLGRNDSPGGISCERDHVALLVNGPDRTFRSIPVQIGATLTRLPTQPTNIASGYGEPAAYAGWLRAGRFGFAPKYQNDVTMVLGKTTNPGTVSLAMKTTGVLELGSGYTSTEYIAVSIKGTKPEKLVIENWDNFEAAD